MKKAGRSRHSNVRVAGAGVPPIEKRMRMMKIVSQRASKKREAQMLEGKASAVKGMESRERALKSLSFIASFERSGMRNARGAELRDFFLENFCSNGTRVFFSKDIPKNYSGGRVKFVRDRRMLGNFARSAARDLEASEVKLEETKEILVGINPKERKKIENLLEDTLGNERVALMYQLLALKKSYKLPGNY